jgi:arabinofuranosyltransferase
MFDRWLAPLREHAQWLLVGVAAIVLIVHSLAYNFVTDDAYISFVYSRNFAEHGELAFNLGDPVEGYTNFLWTVLLGGLMVVGAPRSVSRSPR